MEGENMGTCIENQRLLPRLLEFHVLRQCSMCRRDSTMRHLTSFQKTL